MSFVKGINGGLYLNLPLVAVQSVFPYDKASEYTSFILNKLDENSKNQYRIWPSNSIKFLDIMDGVNDYPRMQVSTLKKRHINYCTEILLWIKKEVLKF